MFAIQRLAKNQQDDILNLDFNGTPVNNSLLYTSGYSGIDPFTLDMYKQGIIDPAKVTRSTLQNAASIASMVLTTECIIVDKMDKN